MTAYNGINLGWGWKEFPNSTTAKNNTVSYNRLINTLRRLHDSGAIYTIGQNPGTNINQNYVKGIPNKSTGPTYGLHNDEGTAFVTENDNVLDIDKNVTYTINCEKYGDKHDLTILRTYATVDRMGTPPDNSKIDPIKVCADNVWPLIQYNNTCVNSGIQDAYMNIIPRSIIPIQDYVFPASCYADAKSIIKIHSSGDSSNTEWFAPSGTASFSENQIMTKAAGNATSITAPAVNGTFRLYVVNSQGKKIGESSAFLRITGGTEIEHKVEVSKSIHFMATISRGNVLIKPQGEPTKYNVSVFMSNGQLVSRNENSSGPLMIPLRARGIYIITIRYDGQNRQKAVVYF